MNYAADKLIFGSGTKLTVHTSKSLYTQNLNLYLKLITVVRLLQVVQVQVIKCSMHRGDWGWLSHVLLL